MTDLSPTIEAKSDQLSADDLISGPRTIKITRVTAGTPEQPIAVHYDGDNGKPWRPCKSMRRVLVYTWGAQGQSYVGRRITLFRDQSVKWGGIEVGGVRISHMSDIESDTVLMLTETRGKKQPYKVRCLAPQPKTGDYEAAVFRIAQAVSVDDLNHTLQILKQEIWTDEQRKMLRQAATERKEALMPMREPGEEG